MLGVNNVNADHTVVKEQEESSWIIGSVGRTEIGTGR